MTKLLDTSEELMVRHCGYGIYLEKPSRLDNDSKGLRVRDILMAPMSSYFLDTDSTIQNANEQLILTCGFPSLQNTIGKNVYIAGDKKSGDFTIQHDREVLKTEQVIIKEESFSRIDKLNFRALTIKFPLYGSKSDLIGVFGFSIASDQHSITDALDFLIKKRLFFSPLEDLQSMKYGKIICGVSLTNREHECLQLIVRGMSMKMVARKLVISPRTVEHHVENIKFKFNVHSKSELVDKLISSLT